MPNKIDLAEFGVKINIDESGADVSKVVSKLEEALKKEEAKMQVDPFQKALKGMSFNLNAMAQRVNTIVDSNLNSLDKGMETYFESLRELKDLSTFERSLGVSSTASRQLSHLLASEGIPLSEMQHALSSFKKNLRNPENRDFFIKNGFLNKDGKQTMNMDQMLGRLLTGLINVKPSDSAEYIRRVFGLAYENIGQQLRSNDIKTTREILHASDKYIPENITAGKELTPEYNKIMINEQNMAMKRQNTFYENHLKAKGYIDLKNNDLNQDTRLATISLEGANAGSEGINMAKKIGDLSKAEANYDILLASAVDLPTGAKAALGAIIGQSLHPGIAGAAMGAFVGGGVSSVKGLEELVNKIDKLLHPFSGGDIHFNDNKNMEKQPPVAHGM